MGPRFFARRYGCAEDDGPGQLAFSDGGALAAAEALSIRELAQTVTASVLSRVLAAAAVQDQVTLVVDSAWSALCARADARVLRADRAEARAAEAEARAVAAEVRALVATAFGRAVAAAETERAALACVAVGRRAAERRAAAVELVFDARQRAVAAEIRALVAAALRRVVSAAASEAEGRAVAVEIRALVAAALCRVVSAAASEAEGRAVAADLVSESRTTHRIDGAEAASPQDGHYKRPTTPEGSAASTKASSHMVQRPS